MISEKWSWKDLPFRVIIHKILSFKLVLLESRLDYFKEIFGYFSRDPSRKLFCLYSCFYNESVDVDENQVLLSFNFRISQIVNFDIVLFQKTATLLSKTSDRFTSLEKLSFSTYSSGTQVDVKFFFTKENCFPKLRMMKMFLSGGIDVDSTLWYKARRMWKSIRCLEIHVISFLRDKFPLFTHQEYFEDLEILGCHNLKVNEKKIRVKLPRLRKISMRHSDVLVIPSEEPIDVCFHTENSKVARDFFQYIPCFRSIVLCGPQRDDQYFDFFLERSMEPKLRHLKQLYFSCVCFSDEKVLEIGESIEFLSLSCCKISKPISLNGNYPNLEKLVLNNSSNFFNGEKKYSFCGHLKLFNISTHSTLSDVFFSQNEWHSLRILNVSSCPCISGEDWNNMPVLKELRIHRLGNVTDSIFCVQRDSEETLESNHLALYSPSTLEKLTISLCPLIKGKNYMGSFLHKVSFLTIYYCDGIEDAFFSENSFPYLRSMTLEGLNGKNFTGKGGWNFSNTLTQICVCDCHNLTDEVFRDIFPELIELVLGSTPLIEGKDWGNGFNKLIRIELFQMSDKFSDEVFQGRRMKNLEYIHVRNCKGVCGKNWGEFESLKEVSLDECGERSQEFLKMLYEKKNWDKEELTNNM